MKKIFVVPVLFFLIFGCGKKVYDSNTPSADTKGKENVSTNAPSPTPIPDAAFAGQRYALKEINGSPIAQGERSCMMQFEKTGQFSAYAGCNNMSGTYFATKNEVSVKFSPVAATRMACPDMETEQQFMKALGMTSQYSFDGEQLLFMDAAGKTVLRLEKM